MTQKYSIAAIVSIAPYSILFLNAQSPYVLTFTIKTLDTVMCVAFCEVRLFIATDCPRSRPLIQNPNEICIFKKNNKKFGMNDEFDTSPLY